PTRCPSAGGGRTFTAIARPAMVHHHARGRAAPGSIERRSLANYRVQGERGDLGPGAKAQEAPALQTAARVGDQALTPDLSVAVIGRDRPQPLRYVHHVTRSCAHEHSAAFHFNMSERRVRHERKVDSAAPKRCRKAAGTLQLLEDADPKPSRRPRSRVD